MEAKSPEKSKIFELINRQNFARALRLDKPWLKFLVSFLYKLFAIEKANVFYDKHKGQPTEAFIDALFEDMQINIAFEKGGLENIPKEGPCWIIANHPTGIWDGLVLMKTISEARKNYKLIAHYFLQQLVELSPKLIPVNSWKEKADLKGNHKSMRMIMEALIKDGQPVGLFPGGSVSRYIPEFGKITDPDWDPVAVKLMQRIAAPIVPIKIIQRNSKWFYFLSRLSPTLRRARNFGEFFNKRGKTYTVKIGQAMSKNELKTFGSIEELTKELRRRLEGL